MSLEQYKHLFEPLQYDKDTDEPYLQLDTHDKIRLTPPRLSDASVVVPLLNEPGAKSFLTSVPQPYLQEHADQWQAFVKDAYDKLIEEIVSKGEGEFISGCPVRSLRELQPDGSWLFLGDVGIIRHGYPSIDDKPGREALKEENLARIVGDKDILWEFGDYVRASHQGQGIMTAATRTLRDKWMIPRMNAHKICAQALEGNPGSVRVFEKIGFVLKETVEITRPQRASDLGKKLQILEWTRKTE